MTPNAERLVHWLASVESRKLASAAFVEALASRFREVDVPLARLATSILTKHPDVFVVNVQWKRKSDENVVVHARRQGIMELPEYTKSPAATLRGNVDALRGHLARGDTTFPIYDELRADGLVDYYATAIVFGDGERSYVSFATDEPAGFADAHIELFEELRPALSLRFELEAARHTTSSLLEVYLGKNAAERVLSGGFRRGTGELVRAAIMFGDLRGFTTFADRRPPAEVVATLDAFFEVAAGHIQDAGGEILKFIGDAVLAVFRGGESDAELAARALRATTRAGADLDAFNARRAEPLGVGVALHFGEVMYGNIGARDRLDFTVIGAAVNEASRIEGLCKVVGERLLMSRAFVDALGDRSGVRSLGAHPVKGVGEPIEVFTLR